MLIPLDASLLNNPGSGFFVATSLLEEQEKSNVDGTGGSVKLFRVDITGYNEREIITPSDASDPAWSPLIP